MTQLAAELLYSRGTHVHLRWVHETKALSWLWFMPMPINSKGQQLDYLRSCWELESMAVAGSWEFWQSIRGGTPTSIVPISRPIRGTLQPLQRATLPSEFIRYFLISHVLEKGTEHPAFLAARPG